MKKVDAVGNVTCFTYDALHRKLSATYPSGSYASVTPSKYFVYDSATVNGAAMTNAKARLAEAYTCFTCPGTKLTDLGFSYTPRGEVSDVYESTQHSGGYYHVPASYWPHGALNQLNALPSGQPSLPGLPVLTYGGTIGSTVGLDGEGRITQVTAGSGQNPVTGVSYNNNASLPTQVTFGSGDSDIFAYDSNTLRLTQFKFNVGTQSKYYNGALTWNPNGSLGQLAITDQFNSADTQTCNYSHDDLVRIATANCGSAASQTFSYDPFGNISTSGSPYAFQPTYNSATNRFSGIPGCSALSYDSNGNVTNDCNHTYAWDADGNSVTIDTVGLSYDALDRMVEQNRSGTYTQIVYGPGGDKLGLMNGQTLNKAFIPLPGQATAIYTSTGLDHYRHSDWLGSARLTSSPSQAYISSVAYAPYGDTYASLGTTDPSFTGMNPDTTGNITSSDYDFLFREYSTQGRWTSPDPAGLAAVDPSNPQSWNRYAYVLNNPLASTDPLGLYCVYLNDAGNGVESIDNNSDSGECNENNGYWIAGNYEAGSFVSIDVNNGTVTGLGFDSFDHPEVSVAGAFGSNQFGAWTQTYVPGGLNWNPAPAATIGPASIDFLNDYCSARGRAKFIADWVPMGRQFVKNWWGSGAGEKMGFFPLMKADIDRITEENSGGQTVALHVASDAARTASKSGLLLQQLRGKTGIAKTLAAKWLERAGWFLVAADATSGYYKEVKEIQSCQAGN